MHYYLSRWAGNGSADAPFQPTLAPEGADWAVIDLRPDPTVVEGRCLLATSQRLAEGTAGRYLGDEPGGAIPPLLRGQMGNELGLTLHRVDLRRIVVELLTDHAREDGTRWQPLRPLRQGRNSWEIWLGDLLWSVPRVAGGATYTDDFTAADAQLDVAGTDLTWTLVDNSIGWAVVSNQAAPTGSASGVVAYARAEHDTASSDVYAQVSVAGLDNVNGNQVGVCVRFASATNTSYMAERFDFESVRIRKTVDGARTNISGDLPGVAYAFPETLRAEAEGSTIRALVDGTGYRTVTDTSITSGTRAGLYAHRSGLTIAVDDFTFGDLSAGGGVEGSLAATLPAVIAAMAGQVTVSGEIGAILPAPAADLSGQVSVVANLTGQLPAPVTDLSGALTVAGQLAGVLPAVTMGAAGPLVVPGSGPPGLSGPKGGVFGPFIGPSQIRQAMHQTLLRWAPTYVAEAARQVGVDLVDFNEWENDAGISATGGDKAPRWSVYCPGTLDVPRRDGDGTHAVTWDIQVNLWLYGDSWQDTEDTLGWYMTALTQALLQHPSLGGMVTTLQWRGVRYQPVQENAFATWGRGILLLAAEVDDVLDAYGGPATVPSPDPTAAPAPAPTLTASQIFMS